MYQISSEPPEFYRRYYEKQIGLIFSGHCIFDALLRFSIQLIRINLRNYQLQTDMLYRFVYWLRKLKLHCLHESLLLFYLA